MKTLQENNDKVLKKMGAKMAMVKSEFNGFTLTNGIYDNTTPLTVDTCKMGVRVLTKAGSHFKIEKIWQNKKRTDDLTVEVGNGKFGNMYGSYKGVFPSLEIQA